MVYLMIMSLILVSASVNLFISIIVDNYPVQGAFISMIALYVVGAAVLIVCLVISWEVFK